MFLGREVTKINVTNHSHIMREKGHGSVVLLPLVKHLCTHLPDVCDASV